MCEVSEKFTYPHILKIKIGAKVILLRNIKVSEGWVNGTIATVQEICRGKYPCITIKRLSAPYGLLKIVEVSQHWEEFNPPASRL